MPFIRNRIALVSYHRKIVDALEGLHQYATSRTTVDIYILQAGEPWVCFKQDNRGYIYYKQESRGYTINRTTVDIYVL